MDIIKQELAAWFAPALEVPPEGLVAEIKPCKLPDMGDLTLACFPFAKALKKNPALVAKEAAEALTPHPLVAEWSAAGPYINVRLNTPAFAERLLPVFDELASAKFVLPIAEPEVCVVDFSSPNVCKEFSLGHLRSTILGAALVKVYQSAGWETVRVNHLGDWGHQFGVVLTAWQEEGDKKALKAAPIKYLQTIYTKYATREAAEVRKQQAHDEKKDYTPDASWDLDADPYLNDPRPAKNEHSFTNEARRMDRALQEGEEEARGQWEHFRDLALASLQESYADLNVAFDAYTGESFFEDKMDAVVETLRDKDLLEESDGAQVVRLDDLGINTPVLVLKRDGTTAYATRDITAAMYRRDEYHFSRNLYVVDARQSFHFAQVFGVLKRMGFSWADGCMHVPFGGVRRDGEMMATRKGNVILVRDYVDELMTLARVRIEDKNPELPKLLGDEALETLCRQVAMGALFFEILKTTRMQDVNFSSTEALRFEGNTGPRLMWTHARACSVERRFIEKFGEAALQNDSVGTEAYTTAQEKTLLRFLGEYADRIAKALDDHEPSAIATYALDIADTFNSLWAAGDQDASLRFITDDVGLSAARIRLANRVRNLLAQLLDLLCMAAPERM